MKKFENSFLNWLVVSSANPDEVALTIKGTIIGIIPVIIFVSQMFHFNWSSDQLTIVAQGLVSIIAGSLVIVGLLRKVYYLFYPNVQAASEAAQTASGD